MRWIRERVCTVLLKYVPGAQKAYDEVVTHYYRSLIEISLPPLPDLFFMPDHINTQGMCAKEVDIEPRFLELVSDRLKTKGMCNKAVRRKPYTLRYVLDWFETQKMCDKAVKYDSSSLQFVPDWFVRTEWVYMWYNDYYDDDGGHWEDDDEDKFFEWYDGYKKRKAQKAAIKEELLPIA